MEFPIELKNAIEARAAEIGLGRLKALAEELSLRYRRQTGQGKKLLTQPEEAVAYAATRMPATFGAVYAALFAALTEADLSPKTLPDVGAGTGAGLSPKTLLDVGAGTGAACWAAAALCDFSRITCLERESAMKNLGQALMREGAPALQRAVWKTADLTKDSIEGAALVIASYVLGEMTGAERKIALQKLWNAAGEMLLLVEPGTPAGFAQLREAREELLAAGAHIAAPCPHEEKCRLEKDDWCHFTCRVPRSQLHKLLKQGDAPYEDEKFAYLALAKSETNKPEARILRHPKIAKGRITLELCGRGENASITVTKKDGARFKAARKAKNGDIFEG